MTSQARHRSGQPFGSLVVRPLSRSMFGSRWVLTLVLGAPAVMLLPPAAVNGGAWAWASSSACVVVVGGFFMLGEMQAARSLLRVEGGRVVHRGVWRERVVLHPGEGGELLEVTMQRARGPQWKHVCLVRDATGRSRLTLYSAGWDRADLQAVATELGLPMTRGATVRDVWAMGRRYPGSLPGWLVMAKRVLLTVAAAFCALLAVAAVAVLAGA